MARLLMEFFASYQYNQPFTHIKDKEGGSIATVSEYTANVYNNFQRIFHQNLRPVFDSHIGNILKIQDVFSTGDFPFEK
jgi:hypothetical protein